MRKAFVAILSSAVVIAACTRDASKPRKPDSTRVIATAPASNRLCSPGPSGRFVVSDDSVGPFLVFGTTMGQVVRSCASADTEQTTRCCYMAMTARVKYPGVTLEGDQYMMPDSAPKYIDTARVEEWEVTGDSIYLAGQRPLPKTVAELASLGPGFAESPDYDDNDGPAAYVCALRSIIFRIDAPRDPSRRMWRLDSSAFNRELKVNGVAVRRLNPIFHAYCLRTADTVSRPPGR